MLLRGKCSTAYRTGAVTANAAITELAVRHRQSYTDLLNRMIQRRKDEEAERERRDHPVRPVQKQAG